MAKKTKSPPRRANPPKNPNDAVIKFLSYYCDAKREFDFAVMVRGKWGCGKTYLINKFLEARAKKHQTKNLYVSLYGLTSFRQIDDALYRQLHPILSSKGMKLAYSITKGVLKASTSFDLGGDGKADVKVDTSIPDVDLADYFKTPKECLLVFDDLERCSIKVSEVLGYINSFVEHEGFKAIIIANEEEILNRKDEQYAEIKEKLVGQTLQVHSAIDAALSHFLTLITNQKTKKYLKDAVATIRQLHLQSGTNNLRLLKQSLWDFERLASCFRAKHWANHDAIQAMFGVVLPLSFEVRSGRLTEDKFEEFRPSLSSFMRKASDPPAFSDELRKRYPDAKFAQTLVTTDQLKGLLFGGWVDPGSITNALDQSPYFVSPANLPAWKAAWHGWDLDDKEYEKAVEKVEVQFSKRQIDNLGEMLQVFGLRLSFADIGVIDATRGQVETECKRYVDDLKTQKRFPDPIHNRRDDFRGVDGLGIQEREAPEFQSIVQHYDKVASQVLIESLPSRGLGLLETMKIDSSKYFRVLCVNNVESAPYYEIPVLAHIKPETFVEHVIALGPDAQASVFSAFRGRYEMGALDHALKEEKEWLRQVKAEFEMRMKSMRPMSKYRLKNRIGHNIDVFLKPDE